MSHFRRTIWTMIGLTLGSALLAGLTACGDSSDRSDGGASIRMASADSTRTLGPGDLRIHSTDSTVQLALIGDTIFAGLGSNVLNKVKQDMDSSQDTSRGLGGTISRLVKSSVQKALGAQLAYPLSDVSDVRCENGRLMILGTDGKELKLFVHSDVNGRPAMESFSAEDCRRFAAAGQSRKGIH